LLSGETAAQLEKWAEDLTAELYEIEDRLLADLRLCKPMYLDSGLLREFRKTSRVYNREKQVRLMRYDFHPVTDFSSGGQSPLSWALSEVNSDVPCGFAESDLLSDLAAEFFPGYRSSTSIAEKLYDSFRNKLQCERIAYVHATSYSDDRQVLQYLHDYFRDRGIQGFFAAPDHIRWSGGKAYFNDISDFCEIGGIIRSFPAEWLHMFRRKCRSGYFDTDIVQCNHPAAVLTQSKRLPLVWDSLRRFGTELPMWRKLLPETVHPDVKLHGGNDGEWLYKLAMSRVGDGISMKGAISVKEEAAIAKAVKRFPKDWVAQRKFISRPLSYEDGEVQDNLHLCLGVFVVDGKAAGFYGRTSTYNLIDSCAADIPILVAKENINV
jgi:glutathionylspermidine synthase